MVAPSFQTTNSFCVAEPVFLYQTAKFSVIVVKSLSDAQERSWKWLGSIDFAKPGRRPKVVPANLEEAAQISPM
jgi:hypothetical protein